MSSRRGSRPCPRDGAQHGADGEPRSDEPFAVGGSAIGSPEHRADRAARIDGHGTADSGPTRVDRHERRTNRGAGRPVGGEPAISVIIPHLDDEAALARCLASLDTCRRAPGTPPVEIVVVDNGSRHLPHRVCAAVPGVRLATEPVPGPGPARNLGARLARAPVLAFIDADCMAAPGWLTAIAAHFARPDSAPVIGGGIGIAMTDPARPSATEAHEAVFGYRQRLYIERDGYAATCNMAVHRTVFEAIGPFAGIGVAEDADWGRRATARGYRIAYLPGMRVLTRARPDLDALARKWARLIGHEYQRLPPGRRARTRWIVRALMIAASPLAELPRIAASDRLPDASARLKAAICTTRIRLWRAGRMLALAAGREAPDVWRIWRQS